MIQLTLTTAQVVTENKLVKKGFKPDYIGAKDGAPVVHMTRLQHGYYKQYAHVTSDGKVNGGDVMGFY
jgi:hypothetical protein